MCAFTDSSEEEIRFAAFLITHFFSFRSVMKYLSYNLPRGFSPWFDEIITLKKRSSNIVFCCHIESNTVNKTNLLIFFSNLRNLSLNY